MSQNPNIDDIVRRALKEDWGKDGYYTKGMHNARIVDSNGKGGAVVVYLGIDSLRSPVALLVDKETLKISFSPISKYPSP